MGLLSRPEAASSTACSGAVLRLDVMGATESGRSLGV